MVMFFVEIKKYDYTKLKKNRKSSRLPANFLFLTKMKMGGVETETVDCVSCRNQKNSVKVAST